MVFTAILLAGAVLPLQAQTNATTTSTNQTSTNAAPAQPKVVAPLYPWKSSIAFGLTLARGNTDTTLASATFGTEKKWPNNDLMFGADGLYGETKNPGQQQFTESAMTALRTSNIGLRSPRELAITSSPIRSRI
jgi:hypothetical protein